MKNRGGGRCSLHSVPCNDNNGCYSVDDMCDGFKQCSDGTDEVSCGQTTQPDGSDITTSPVGCPSETSCLDFNDRRICLRDQDLCDGVFQCREGFDESSCAPHRNPYILPTLVSLGGVLLIVIIMCIVYKLCVYRYTSNSVATSNRVNNDQSTSCSTVFLKRQCGGGDTETCLQMHQLEPSDKSETSETGVEACLTAESREQCVQFPSQDEADDDEEGEADDEESVTSSSNWVSTTI